MAPGATRTTAVIDTGAEMTVIRPTVAQALLLSDPIRRVPLAGVAGIPQMAPVYAVRLVVGEPGNASAPINIAAVVAELVGDQHGCLLGRDVLRYGGLAWYGDAHHFQLVLPR